MPFQLIDASTAAAAPVISVGSPLTSVGQTLDDFQADLKEELGNRGDVTAVQLKKWINKGYEYLCSILTVQQLFAQCNLSLVATQPFYLLPSGLVRILSLSIVDKLNYPIEGGYKLVPVEAETYRKLPEDTVNLPSTYLRDDTVVAIYPTPRISYTAILEFRFRVKPLVNPTDSPILAPEFHEALLLRAKHVAFRALKSYTESGVARNDFVADVRALEDSDAIERAEVPMGVRPIRSDRDYNRLIRPSRRHTFDRDN